MWIILGQCRTQCKARQFLKSPHGGKKDRRREKLSRGDPRLKMPEGSRGRGGTGREPTGLSNQGSYQGGGCQRAAHLRGLKVEREV